MIRDIKIKDKEYYPEGQWVRICNERDRDVVDDEDIYFYVTNDIKLSKLKIGQKIDLDEEFIILALDEENWWNRK